jgi:hypothetical protein
MGIDQLDTVCFQSQVLPILQTSCGMAGCHGSGGEHSEGFNPSTYQGIMDIVTPGSAAKSKLYQIITQVNGDNMMPQNQPLTKEQRTLILVWIQQGAKNTTCPTTVNAGTRGTPIIIGAIKQ